MAGDASDPPIFGKAVELHLQGNLPQAARLYVAVLKIASGHFGALNGLGVLRSQQGKRDDAVKLLSQAAAAMPGSAGTHVNLGNALREAGRHDAAAASYRQALAIEPRDADALYNLGNSLAALDRFAEAIEAYDRALALKPGFVEALSNKGSALMDLHQFDAACASFDRVLALQPEFPEAHYNQSLAHLFRGNFARGWAKYEWRWKTQSFDSRWREYPAPRWNGGQVDGVLLAWAEQGVGDQILHAGMVADLQARSRRLALEVDGRLVPLLQRSFPSVTLTVQSGLLRPGRVAAATPFGSIGTYCRRSWRDFPARPDGYLKADAAQVQGLRDRLSPDGRLLVGLSWRSVNRRVGHAKSVPLEQLSEILAVPGCRFVDLQYGDTTQDREALALKSGTLVERIAEIDNRMDIDGLASLVAACDLVIGVSNTTAHLAGALGRPAWVLLPSGLGQLWYWFLEREDSPWYPSVKLLRQPRPGDWASVTHRAAAMLRLLVAARAVLRG